MASNFDFQSLLSPYDFELLVRDLLSLDLNCKLFAFAQGKDKGIDLRGINESGKKIVVQCKRTKTLSSKTLEEEKKKIQRYKRIDEYYLATSFDPSVDRCNNILNIFAKWMKDDKNIYSRTRLNSLLDQYSEVLRHHYKLWLNNSEVIELFINNDIYGRSDFFIKDTAKELKYYVKSKSFNAAVDILNKHHFLLISGIPGIGKTTLAKILLWEYIQHGYEIIKIATINEGEKIIKEYDERKIALFFDDFLGENFLEYDTIKGRAYDLVMFIKRILNSTNKKLIMTTREYILNQAKNRYPKLKQEEFDIFKYTLDLNQYSKDIRALILYNHLYYSGLNERYILSIIEKKAYKGIINHANYSPRIIEAMTVKLKESTIPPNHYADKFIENLNNPIGIWEDTFESEISECSQHILFLLTSIGSSILKRDLEKAFDSFVKVSLKDLNLKFSHKDFDKSLKELSNTFITINVTTYNTFRIDFQNPSIKDFLLEHIKKNKTTLSFIIKSCPFFNQLRNLWHIVSKTALENDLQAIFIQKFLSDFDNLSSSSLVQWAGTINSWHISEIYKIEMLSWLSNRENENLKEFIVKKYEELSINELSPNGNPVYHLNLLKNLKRHGLLKPDRILPQYFEYIETVDEIRGIKTIEEVFPETFGKYFDSYRGKLLNEVEQIIKAEVECYDDLDYLHELHESLNEIEELFQTEFSSVRGKLLDRIEDIEELENEKKLTNSDTELSHFINNEFEDAEQYAAWERGGVVHSNDVHIDSLFTPKMFSIEV
ncbi:MAG: restriction endonuclease [Tissierellales bacterium]|nr:restriction endonuclease [Tissierellales bacterium]